MLSAPGDLALAGMGRELGAELRIDPWPQGASLEDQGLQRAPTSPWRPRGGGPARGHGGLARVAGARRRARAHTHELLASNGPTGLALLLPHWPREETEARRGEVTC